MYLICSKELLGYMAGCEQGEASVKEMNNFYRLPFSSVGSIQQSVLQYWLTGTVIKSYPSFQGTAFRKR